MWVFVPATATVAEIAGLAMVRFFTTVILELSEGTKVILPGMHSDLVETVAQVLVICTARDSGTESPPVQTTTVLELLCKVSPLSTNSGCFTSDF